MEKEGKGEEERRVNERESYHVKGGLHGRGKGREWEGWELEGGRDAPSL